MSVNVWDKKNNKLITVAGLTVAKTTEYVSVANMPSKSTYNTNSITGTVSTAELNQAVIGEIPWNNTIVNSVTSEVEDNASEIINTTNDTATVGEPPLPTESISADTPTVGEPPLADTESEEV